MDKKQQKLVKSILGGDFFTILEKSEITGGIVKINTNTAIDPEEIKIALQIVPRAILSFLFFHLKDHSINNPIELQLPFANGILMAKKHGPDNYSGEVIKEGKRAVEFKFRSLPGIGLILMSTFELYDISQLDEIKHSESQSPKIDKLQELIDERLQFNNLIESVVTKKILEKEAINQLIQIRLSQHIQDVNSIRESESMEQSNKGKLREFLKNREKKNQEANVILDKSELICPDCGTSLYKGGKDIKLCICYGLFHNKNIKIEKNERGGAKLKFPKNFDIDNVEMILDAIKDSNNEEV